VVPCGIGEARECVEAELWEIWLGIVTVPRAVEEV
jgi:hypothetical protein